jgi:hypothetical protein
VHPPVAQPGGIEDVFGRRGQVDLLAHGEPALIAREDEKRTDEMLRVIDRGADVRRHAAQVAGRAAVSSNQIAALRAAGAPAHEQKLCTLTHAAINRKSGLI